MKFGIGFANILHWTTAQGAVEFGQAAEAAGFDSIWTVEHVVYPDSYASEYPYDPTGRMPMTPDTPLPDPLIWLTWVATATTTLRLGTGILILPQRNPVVLAKSLGTLDSMSGGRVSLGVGVGWLKEEFAALGIPWERRGQRTDDYIGAMRALWDGDSVSYDSDHASFSGVSMNPKPANGRVPIVIGGHSRAAARRAGRLGDGFWPGPREGVSMAELIDEMRQTAAAAGRDPESIEITVGLPNTPMDDPAGLIQEVVRTGRRPPDRPFVPVLCRHSRDDGRFRPATEGCSPMSQIQQYHAAAIERTGLDDFGRDDYMEGLTVLEESLEAEAGMTDIGRFAIGEIITQALMGRLRAEAGLKARPEAADVNDRAAAGHHRAAPHRHHRLAPADGGQPSLPRTGAVAGGDAPAPPAPQPMGADRRLRQLQGQDGCHG